MIGLIDVDGHHFPNLCLMKLSQWHKDHGDTVEWYRPDTPMYDAVYMSKVFSAAYSPDIHTPTNAKKVIKGGTGYAIWLVGGKEVYHPAYDPPLKPEIESCYPDYSLYPEYTGWGKSLARQTAYGFLTRGCPRACEFCHVAPKEGRVPIRWPISHNSGGARGIYAYQTLIFWPARTHLISCGS